jgi:hypothetical protein
MKRSGRDRRLVIGRTNRLRLFPRARKCDFAVSASTVLLHGRVSMSAS